MRSLQTKIGILGGGQLSRMLCLEGHKLGLEMHVLSDRESDPAAQVVRHWHKGDIHATQDVEALFRSVDRVIIESEFLNSDLLRQAERGTKTSIFPKVRLIAELSDRLSQKNWLKRFRIPTSRFSGLANAEDIFRFQPDIRHGIVLKKRRFGYDGNGTFLINSKSGLKKWLQKYEVQISEFIIEDFVPFEKELAQQFTVSGKSVCSYPLVEWQAENSRCLWVKGPVTHPGIKLLAKRMSKALVQSGFVGTVAFELFSTGQKLIVNEVAPRVHNSGHYSLDALDLNQFSAHLLAVLGRPLPKQARLKSRGFAMLNWIAKKNSTSKAFPPVTAEGRLHWYGKNEFRFGRKMGHINFLADSPESALRAALKTKKRLLL